MKNNTKTIQQIILQSRSSITDHQTNTKDNITATVMDSINKQNNSTSSCDDEKNQRSKKKMLLKVKCGSLPEHYKSVETPNSYRKKDTQNKENSQLVSKKKLLAKPIYVSTSSKIAKLQHNYIAQSSQEKNYLLESKLHEILSSFKKSQSRISGHNDDFNNTKLLSYDRMITILNLIKMTKHSCQRSYQIQTCKADKQELQSVYSVWYLLKRYTSTSIPDSKKNLLSQCFILIQLILLIQRITYQSESLLRFIEKNKHRYLMNEEAHPKQQTSSNQILKQNFSFTPKAIFFINKQLKLVPKRIQCLNGISWTYLQIHEASRKLFTQTFQIFRVNRLFYLGKQDIQQHQQKPLSSQNLHILNSHKPKESFRQQPIQKIQSFLSPKSQQLALNKRLKIINEFKKNKQATYASADQSSRLIENIEINISDLFFSYRNGNSNHYKQKYLKTKYVKQKDSLLDITRTQILAQKSSSSTNKISQNHFASVQKSILLMKKAQIQRNQTKKMIQKGWSNMQAKIDSSSQLSPRQSVIPKTVETNKPKQNKQNNFNKFSYINQKLKKTLSNKYKNDNKQQQQQQQKQQQQQQQQLTLYKLNLNVNVDVDQKNHKSSEQQNIYFQNFIKNENIQDYNNQVVQKQWKLQNISNNNNDNDYENNESKNSLLSFDQLDQHSQIEHIEQIEKYSFQEEKVYQIVNNQLLKLQQFKDKDVHKNIQSSSLKKNGLFQQTQKQESHREIKSYLRIPILYVDVNMDQTRKERITIHEDDDPHLLAQTFAKVHRLTSEMEYRLEIMLKQQINGILGRIDQQTEEEESQDSSFDL